MDYLKTANVTTTKNVLVQIPSWVVRKWNLVIGDTLEVRYDTERDEVVIRPNVQR